MYDGRPAARGVGGGLCRGVGDFGRKERRGGGSSDEKREGRKGKDQRRREGEDKRW